jgi:hypothetical protein
MKFPPRLRRTIAPARGSGRRWQQQPFLARLKTRIRATKKLESDFSNTKRIDISWYPNRVE